MAKLTKKQLQFVNEYMIDMNATKAAIRAGYSAKTASRIAVELLNKTHVSDAVHVALTRRAHRTEVTADRVISELAKLAFFDPRKLFDADGKPVEIADLDDDTAACVAGLDVQDSFEYIGGKKEFVGYVKKYKLADKKGALELLARHLGLLIERVALKAEVESSWFKDG